MHHSLIRHLATTLLSCSAAAAIAATPAGAEPSRVEVIVDRAALTAAQAVLTQAPFDQSYVMSTGRRLDVASHGSALKMRYGSQARATLRHDGQGRFVSSDGVLALRFQLDESGEPQVVTLSLPAQWQ